MLAMSALPVLKAIGQTVAIGIFSRLLRALVLIQLLAVNIITSRPAESTPTLDSK